MQMSGRIGYPTHALEPSRTTLKAVVGMSITTHREQKSCTCRASIRMSGFAGKHAGATRMHRRLVVYSRLQLGISIANSVYNLQKTVAWVNNVPKNQNWKP